MRSPRPARMWRSSRYSLALNELALAGPGITELRGPGEVDVVVVERLAVDAGTGRCDPCRNLAPFVYRLHQRPHVGLVDIGRQPSAAAALPLLRGKLLAFR